MVTKARAAREREIIKAILDYLNSLEKCKAIKIHGSAFMEAGTPDIICCYQGLTLLFEVKRPGGNLSELQKLRLVQWSEAGAAVQVVTSADEVKTFLTRLATGS